MKIADNPFYIGVFPNGIGTKIENTAEAIATFIVDSGVDYDLKILTPDEDTVLNTFGIWIDRCSDQDFLTELKEVLIPKQKKLTKELGFPDCP